jgi:hypothetical protein
MKMMNKKMNHEGSLRSLRLMLLDRNDLMKRLSKPVVEMKMMTMMFEIPLTENEMKLTHRLNFLEKLH